MTCRVLYVPGTADYCDLSPPTRLVPTLYEPNLALRVLPLGVILLVDASASIMLANIFELYPQNISLATRIVPPGGVKSR